MTILPEALNLLSDLIARAKRAGADAADAVISEGVSVMVGQRLGQPEKLERAEGQDMGLRVLVGRQQAIVSSNDLSPRMMDELAQRAVAMAKLAPEDPYCGLADADAITTSFPELDTLDADEPPVELLIDRAKIAEAAARAVPGITNSEGADAAWSRTGMAMVTSNGFAGQHAVTRHSLSATVLAGSGLTMERDYDYSVAVHGRDLEDPALVGRRAGERTMQRLNPRKVETCKVPVLFDRRVAGSLLGHLSGAISGPAIARGTSFLKDMLGQPVFAPGITVLDDPHRRAGLRSRPFDGEGLATRSWRVIDQGVLTTWLLDLRSARQLGLASTGHASRGSSSPPSPSPSNFFFQPGPDSPEALMQQMGRGLLVTHLMGMGVNGVTGDYSRGAAGFWIEDGRIAYPVSEITIASNLKDMYRTLVAASDLEFRSGMDSPSLLVAEMTIAGT